MGSDPRNLIAIFWIEVVEREQILVSGIHAVLQGLIHTLDVKSQQTQQKNILIMYRTIKEEANVNNLIVIWMKHLIMELQTCIYVEILENSAISIYRRKI